MMNSDVYNPINKARLVAYVEQSQKAAMMVPAYMFGVVLFIILSIGILAMEWSLGYGLFSDLLGEDEGYFSPEALAFSTVIVVLAIHFLAHSARDHRIAKWIDAIASKMVLIYAVGLGLTFASILFVYLLDLLPEPEIDLLLETPMQSAEHWAETLMNDVTSPLSVLLLCAGLGSLIIINVCVVNHCLNLAITYTDEIIKRSKAFKADKKDYQTYVEAEQQCAALQAELEHEISKDDERLKEMVAQDYLNALDEPLRHAEVSLNQLQLGTETYPGNEAPINSKVLEKKVNALRAITLETLLNQMK